MMGEQNIAVRFIKDAEVIAKLNEYVHQPHHLRQPAIFRPYAYDAALEVVHELLAKNNSYGLIAYRDQEPVGYAIVLRREYPPSMFQPGHRSLFIDQMAVKPDSQGRGVGKKLMKALAELGRKEGIKRIELGVWADNQGAKAFYDRCGFKTYSQQMYLEL